MTNQKEEKRMKLFVEEQRKSQETESKKDINIENIFTTTAEENQNQTQELNVSSPEITITVDEYKVPDITSNNAEVEVITVQQPTLTVSDVQGKTGQIFQNAVAATTSVAVVVVATPLFDNVNAQFLELKILEDQIYYEVEIYESVGEDQEPNGRPLRLIIESQWDTIEVELNYGLNQNFLTDLRPNAQYTFTVQMDKGIIWNTLVSQRVQTESELAGVVGPATTIPSIEGRLISLNAFAQSGGVDVQFYQFVVIENGQAIISIPVSEGEQIINFMLPSTNNSFIFQLQAVTASSELVILDSRPFIPKAIFESTLAATYLYPHKILVQPTIIIDDFIDVQYRLVLKQNNLVVENLLISNDVLLDIVPNASYTLDWVAVYTDPRTNVSHQDVLSSISINTPPNLFYIIQEIRKDDNIQIIMQFENFLSLIDRTYVDIIDSSGNIQSLVPMQFITSQFNTGLYEWQSSEAFPSGSRIEIGVILKVNPNQKVPLYQINP